MADANIKYKRIFDKKVDRYGQSAILLTYSNGNYVSVEDIHNAMELHELGQIPLNQVSGVGERCPCYNETTGYGDPGWHRKNPNEPNCDDECYIYRPGQPIPLKAFIFPASDIDKKGFKEIVLAAIGQVNKDDYVYIGKSDLDIFNLSEKDYLVYKNKRWKIKNPDVYKIGDIDLTYMALLELIGEDKNE